MLRIRVNAAELRPANAPRASKFPELDFLYGMVWALSQHEACARHRRQNIFAQIGKIDLSPDGAGSQFSSLVIEIRVFLEVGQRIAKGGVAQPHEAGDKPFFEIFLGCVEVNRKVEEIGNKRARATIFISPVRRKHIEALE